MLDDLKNKLIVELFSRDFAWWIQRLEKTQRRNGRVSWQYENGTEQFSPNFWESYGYSKDNSPNNSVLALVTKDDQPKVIKLLKHARQGEENPQVATVKFITKQRKTKLVEVYTRLIKRNGHRYVASIHSNVRETVIKNTILDKLKCLVFIKRFDLEANQFQFVYANDQMLSVLGADTLHDVIGASDGDFISDESQIEGFKKQDFKVLTAAHEEFILPREEVLQTKSQTSPLRLMTFKLPYEENGERLVLGISFQTTPITDMTRILVNSVDNGIYVKDEERRYVAVNRQFCKIMGASKESELLHHTFGEAIENLKTLGKIQNQDFSQLVSVVDEEDRNVLMGSDSTTIRTASFHDNAEWITEKKPHQSNGEQYILGTISPMSSGPLANLLNYSPQCVCLKRVNFGKPIGDENRTCYVWGNREFLAKHKLESVSDLEGLTDFDLWKHDHQHARAFQRKDEKIISLFQSLRRSESWKTLDSYSQWQEVVKQLKIAECWEYRRNEVLPDGSEIIVQTTKWIRVINDQWFIVVVFSDVTFAESELHQYHKWTVHSIRNAIGPIDFAITHLQDYKSSNPSPNSNIDQALDCLLDFYDSSEKYLHRLRDTLRLDLKFDYCRPSQLLGELLNEVDKTKRRSRRQLQIEVDEPSFDLPHKIKVDTGFMQQVFAEILLNAEKATSRRREEMRSFKNRGIDSKIVYASGWNIVNYHYTGKVNVYARLCKKRKSFSITFQDDGIASANLEAKQELLNHFDTSIDGNRQPFGNERLGLAFCNHVLEKHDGRLLRPKVKTDGTEISIKLPLIAID